jgi:hypothetical protein
MTTAATSLLGLALPVTGELSGTWGDTVNNSITSLVDSAVAGTTTLSSDADVTLTTTTLAANQARQAVILWTAGGTVTRTITVPASSKTYVVINNTSSTQSITVKAATGTGVTVLAGTRAIVAWDGTNFVSVGGGSAAGSTTQVQYNSSGAFAGSANMTFDGTKLTVGNILDSGLTASKPVFTDASKNLVSTGTLGVDQGGTGLTSTPTNGQLDIGNGTGFTRTTLTAGSNITITNASGSITIASAGGASITIGLVRAIAINCILP